MQQDTYSADDEEPSGAGGKPRESNKKQKLIPIRSIRHLPDFPCNPDTIAFRNRFFPSAIDSEWNDWRWQLRNRITNIQGLSRILLLSDAEFEAIGRPGRSQKQIPLAITPYYASLLKSDDPLQPLRRTVVPLKQEFVPCPGEAADPLGEDRDSPAPGLVHRYPDRVLFLVTAYCSTYCRYCTRSRILGRIQNTHFSKNQWEKAIAYIQSTPSVRDVLLSGGDPLTMPDEKLDWILRRLRRIPHVEIVRIGTKAPVVLPQRVTKHLTRMLKRHHPLLMSIHFTHPDELTPEVSHACGKLADAGIPLGSQTVLLSGVNDDVETMKRLFRGLLKLRVRPYYLYQCDPIPGSGHFRTSIQKGLEIIQGLRGYTSGYAVPHYVIDAPGGGGKIPMLPEYVVGREGGDLLIKNYAGKIYRYPDPDRRVVVEKESPEASFYVV